MPTPRPLAVALVAAGTALVATALPWVSVDGFTSRSALEGAGLVLFSPIASLVVGFFLRSNLPSSVTAGGVYLLRASFIVSTVFVAVVFASLSSTSDTGFSTVRVSDVASTDIGLWVYMVASMAGLVASLVLRWDGANDGARGLQPGSEIGPVYFGPPPDVEA